MYIGLDYGTSEVKALLMNEMGEIIATRGARLTVQRPQPMHSEQNPLDWWTATLAVLSELRADFSGEYQTVKGIGLSGQMHGAVLLDADSQVLRPAILWNDARSHLECEELTAAVPNLHVLAGNLAMPGFTAPKLLWVAKHEPEIFSATHKVLLPKDYIRWLLTGEMVSDMSDAAGTLWLDVARRDWSDELLAACGLTRAHMPRLVEGSAPSGTLSEVLAAQIGLTCHVVVAGGGGDNAASAVGIGAVTDGDGFISLGTSGVLFVVNDDYRPNAAEAVHAFCHALPNRWHQMSVMLSAASCLRWVCQLTHAANELELLSEVEVLIEPAETAPIFLPYLSGERTPHNDAHAQGVFFGLTHETRRAHMGYAVLEGVAFGLKDGLRALQEAGTDVQTLSLVGGGSRSRYWAQLLADVLQVTITTHTGSEAGGALGAARLGALACGVDEAVICVKPPILQTFTPHAETAILEARYQKFRAIYPVIKPIF